MVVLALLPMAVVHINVKVAHVAFKLFFCIGFYLLILAIAMCVIYISQLHLKLKTFNVENSKLLNGMHEGLLILKKSNKDIMFSNKQS